MAHLRQTPSSSLQTQTVAARSALTSTCVSPSNANASDEIGAACGPHNTATGTTELDEASPSSSWDSPVHMHPSSGCVWQRHGRGRLQLLVVDYATSRGTPQRWERETTRVKPTRRHESHPATDLSMWAACPCGERGATHVESATATRQRRMCLLRWNSGAGKC
eukprot:1873945-Rhodomonas_salina.2